MREQQQQSITTEKSYHIRRYRPDDIEGILALDRAVWNRRRTAQWYKWKYEQNPYVDHVPIFVAETDGKIVGARPFIGFQLRAGDETAIALQPADTAVHPDHRRRGLFTRMTKRALEFYVDREPDLFFNFPNEQAIGGYVGLGWRDVGPRMVYYRVQNPGPFLAGSVGGSAGRLLRLSADTLSHGYYHARRRYEPSPDGFGVDRLPYVPIDLLKTLYDRAVPCQLHALRDERYYGWSLDSPAWEYVTHVARRDGSPVAAIVSRTRETNAGITVTQLAETVPMGGDRTWTDAVRSLVGSVTAAADDVDLISTVESPIPRRVLSEYGFISGFTFPLRRFRPNPSTFVVRPIDTNVAEPWRLNGRLLTDRKSWLFSFCEHDTA